MRKIVSGIVLIASTVLFAQDSFNLHSVIVDNPADTMLWQARTSKGGISGARGVWSGSDLDQDGRQEIWVTDYTDGGKVHAFEWYYGDTLVHVWSSEATNSTYSTGTRWVQTGDLDGDGLGEVIFFAGRYASSDTAQGLYVYEWDGVSDNGYGMKPTWHRNMHTVYKDTISRVRVEHFSVDDIDGDGKQEIIYAHDDWPSDPAFGTTSTTHAAYSGDRFTIASVSGDIGSSITPPVLIEEYSISPRDVDKDGVRENALGGGSPQSVVIADMDGDGKKEAVCISWNGLAVFVIEATGPDAYTLGDTTYIKLADTDDWTLAAAVADVNKDGKDEVYIPGYYDKQYFIIADNDGESTTLTSSEWAVLDSANGYAHGASASNNAFGDPAVFFPNGQGTSMFQYTGTGSVLDSSQWTRTDYMVETHQTGDVLKLFAGANLDRDSYGEVILGYLGVSDSLYTGTDTAKVNPTSNRVILRVLEYSGKSTELSVKDVVIITPEDYKLSQNYPNPFNPTTTIEYTLPIASRISISIFNVMGQEVANIIQNQDKPAGTYQVTWNGTDKNGNQVASGTYFYSMRFGNFTKTKQMTFMK